MIGGPLTLAHCRSLSCAAPFDLALRTTSAHNKSVNTCGPNALLRPYATPRCEGVENIALRDISVKRIAEMTPTGSRSKAQGCPRCVRETLGRCAYASNPERVAYRTTQPFQGWILPAVNPGFPADNAGNPGLCYVTPSALKTVNKPPAERTSPTLCNTLAVVRGSFRSRIHARLARSQRLFTDTLLFGESSPGLGSSPAQSVGDLRGQEVQAGGKPLQLQIPGE